jgi:hypothetical protein
VTRACTYQHEKTYSRDLGENIGDLHSRDSTHVLWVYHHGQQNRKCWFLCHSSSYLGAVTRVFRLCLYTCQGLVLICWRTDREGISMRSCYISDTRSYEACLSWCSTYSGRKMTVASSAAANTWNFRWVVAITKIPKYGMISPHEQKHEQSDARDNKKMRQSK